MLTRVFLEVLGGGTIFNGGIALTKSLMGPVGGIVDDLEQFKREGHKEGCVKDLFGEVNEFGVTESITTGPEEPMFGKGKPTEGCLAVNWDRSVYAEKWTGNIRLVWTVKGEAKNTEGQSEGPQVGFAAYLLGKIDNTGQKLQWKGIVYSMRRDTGSGPWKADKHNDVETDKSFVISEADETQFPGPNSKVLGLGDEGYARFWNFIIADGPLSQAAKEENPLIGLRGQWTWKGVEPGSDEDEEESTEKKRINVDSREESHRSKQKLTDWSRDIGTWWPELFGRGIVNISEDLIMQEGQWTPKTLSFSIRDDAADRFLPVTVQSFKERGHEQDCVRTLFGAITPLGEPAKDENRPSDALFAEGKRTDGCLVVNRIRRGNAEKWFGNIGFLWAAKGEAKPSLGESPGKSRGFIAYWLGTADKEGQKLKWDGRIYALEQDAADEAWKVTGRNDVEDNRSFGAFETDESMFPSPDEKVLNLQGNHKFWGLFENSRDLAKIADEGELEGAESSNAIWRWNWIGMEPVRGNKDGTDEYREDEAATKPNMIEWSRAMRVWWPELFGDGIINVTEDLPTQVGTWTGQ